MPAFFLQTPRLHIRNLRASDLADFHVYRSNPEVTRYQGFDVMDEEQAAAFIADQAGRVYGVPGAWIQLGIEEKTGGSLVGDCALHLQAYDPRIAEIGITISHLHQQQGYARETLEALLAFLFEEQDIHRVVETVDAENVACIALLERLGFRQEGHFIENIFFKGKWGSEYQYAMLAREWQARKPL